LPRIRHLAGWKLARHDLAELIRGSSLASITLQPTYTRRGIPRVARGIDLSPAADGPTTPRRGPQRRRQNPRICASARRASPRGPRGGFTRWESRANRAPGDDRAPAAWRRESQASPRRCSAILPYGTHRATHGSAVEPGCRIVEFRLRCLRLTLRLWAAVGGEVFGGEAAVADETRSGTYSRDSCPEARGAGRGYLKAQELPRFSARGDTKAIGRRRGGEDLPSTSGHYARVHRGFTPRSGAINLA
jgi:hypothetical protein